MPFVAWAVCHLCVPLGPGQLGRDRPRAPRVQVVDRRGRAQGRRLDGPVEPVGQGGRGVARAAAHHREAQGEGDDPQRRPELQELPRGERVLPRREQAGAGVDVELVGAGVQRHRDLAVLECVPPGRPREVDELLTSSVPEATDVFRSTMPTPDLSQSLPSVPAPLWTSATTPPFSG